MSELLNDPFIPALLAGIAVVMMLGSIWSAAPWLAAMIGRYRIESELNSLARKGAVVMHQLHLPDKRGESTYIEHLIVTNRRIICLEKLGYAGDIFGSLRDARWSAQTSQGTHRFDNPVRHQEAMRNTVTAILGTRMDVETISVFTAGKLHGDYGHHVIESGSLHAHMERLCEGDLTGPKLTWARQILNNIAIINEEEHVSAQTFLNNQGSKQRLKLAKLLIAVGGMAMLLAVAFVVANRIS